MPNNDKVGRIGDYCKTYDGTNTALFATFLEDFDLGVETMDVDITKQCGLLVSCLDGTPKHVAKNYIKEFKANHPDITDGNAATRRERHGELLKGLKEALVADPAVVGAKPTDKLLNKWGSSPRAITSRCENTTTATRASRTH